MVERNAGQGDTITNHPIRVFAIVAVLVLSLPILSPVVSAGRGGQMHTVLFEQYVGPDNRHNWTDLINLANASDMDVYNAYNTSWVPFFENNTDVAGVLATPPLLPLVVERNTTGYWNWSTIHKFQVQPELVMDGASEAWFRLPMSNIAPDAKVTTRLWRLIVQNVNISSVSGATITFTDSADVELIYNVTTDYSETWIDKDDVGGSVYDQLRWQNVTVNANYSLNMTYSKVCAPIFSGEWYYLAFTITDGSATNASLLLTNSDMFEDEYVGTWVHWGGSDDFYVCDLDFSVVFTKGLSNGITGTPDIADPGATYTHLMISSIVEYEHLVVAGDYLNLIMPVVKTNSSAVPFNLSIMVRALDTGMVDTGWYCYDVFELESTRDFAVIADTIGSIAGTTVGYLNITVEVAEQNKDDFKLYLQASKDETRTDIYLHDWIVPGNDSWTRIYYGGFHIFSHVYINESYWDYINYSIIVIPVEEPEDPQTRFEEYHDYILYLRDESGTSLGEFIVDVIWQVAIQPIIDGLIELAKLAYEVWLWFMDNTVGAFLDSDWWETIKGIGVFIWDIIELLIDALEWFSYWGVRIIYGFSIALVYMVNVFVVISINTGLLALARSGNGKDLVRAFNSGWRFVFAIITLMLSLLVLAISIVSAVVPF